MEDAFSRDFKGVWIPKEIYLLDISPTKKILLAEIDSLDRGEGCFAGNERLASFIGVSESRLADILTELRKEGLIVDRGSNGRKRFISIAGSLGSWKQEGRVPENRKDHQALSNTHNNTVFPPTPQRGEEKTLNVEEMEDEELEELTKQTISPYYKPALQELRRRKRASKSQFPRTTYKPKLAQPWKKELTPAEIQEVSLVDNLPEDQMRVIAKRLKIPAWEVNEMKKKYILWIKSNKNLKAPRDMVSTVELWLVDGINKGTVQKSQEAQIEEMFG